MMTDCFSPACSGSKALPSLTFCGMMTSQSVSNSMGVVGSTLYSKGTHNHFFMSGCLKVCWIYPLFEGYTQHMKRSGEYRKCWIYPLFEGYTQLVN